MAGLVVLIIGLVAISVAASGAAIGGTIDACLRPATDWSGAGCRKLAWVWQAIGAVCLPVALVYSGLYFLRIRPRLIAVQRARAAADWSPFSADLGSGQVASLEESGSDAATVKIRILVGFRVAAGVFGFATGAGIVAISISSHGHGVLSYLVWQWLIMSVVYSTTWGWFGINLTPDEAVVNSFRRHRVPWRCVQAVTQEPFFGGRRVVLWTERGERIPLRAPIVDFTSIGARAFDRDFHNIGRWWLRHRGRDWRPVG